ncbi:IclR family transcriptional regulator [Aerococcus sp. JJEM-2022b]|uniref:IclR family transcriptional regulator n=1 Tax=Aerococcus mictus TaxID=2976810 RepID=UPI00227B1B52|nr:IclR family transcriptional regulator [Aerococcus mictus]MCY3063505.1 IclR family transcriptional regulator [Aerococcus mictus]
MAAKSDLIQAIINADNIMSFINNKREAGVSEISKELSLSKTTCYRILKTLEYKGLVIQTTNDNYAIGYRILSYKAGCSRETNLVHTSKPFIDQLANEIGETVSLVIERQEKCIYIYSKEGEYYTLQSNIGSEAELYISSTGKIFLSQWELDRVKKYYSNNLRKQTINTITSYDRYLLERKSILKKGYAIDKEEYEYGLTCIGVPVFIDQSIIAAISISGPTTRLEYKGLLQMAELVKEIAGKLSNHLPKELDTIK